ncbi:hypothetical protein SAMN04487916_11155 [Arthrobacter sp. ov407]|nr:hypothetical protein SAMN04487916_11155 [Arthrobacter sp. ov407]
MTSYGDVMGFLLILTAVLFIAALVSIAGTGGLSHRRAALGQ